MGINVVFRSPNPQNGVKSVVFALPEDEDGEEETYYGNVAGFCLRCCSSASDPLANITFLFSEQGSAELELGRQYFGSHPKETPKSLGKDITRISRVHCKIALDKEGNFALEDAAANGTWVNGKLVGKGRRSGPLKQGDHITLLYDAEASHVPLLDYVFEVILAPKGEQGRQAVIGTRRKKQSASPPKEEKGGNDEEKHVGSNNDSLVVVLAEKDDNNNDDNERGDKRSKQEEKNNLVEEKWGSLQAASVGVLAVGSFLLWKLL